MPRHQLPAAAAAVATASAEAVEAARAADPDRFARAGARLAALDPEQVGLVLGAVVRSLLEEQHPDGLTGDDLQAVAQRCQQSAARWGPAVDPVALGVVLTSALGVHEADEDRPRPVAPLDIVRHAALLVADLLATSGGSLAPYLDAAFAEIARAEAIEPP